MEPIIPAWSREHLRLAGLTPSALETWATAVPRLTCDYEIDRVTCGQFWKHCDDLIAQLPGKIARNAVQQDAASTIQDLARRTRQQFLQGHVGSVYARLTRDYSDFVRVEQLVLAAADAIPGLVPNRTRLAAENELIQRDKEGLEIDQGILLSHILADERSGRHLCHAMLLPRIETHELLARFATDGVVDLKAARIERRGKAAYVFMQNPRYLNAEDQTTIEATEICVDLAILDPTTEIAVLRGGVVEHAKYRGRHILGSGINLTHLYRGKIPFVWFLQRDLGFVHKFMRGVGRPDVLPDDVHGQAVEKPWVAALDTFAIGGHCQILLTMDYVLAADDAYMTLPARKEGIIPGFANLRLPRLTGERMARQAIQYDRKLACNSPEGRLICDEIVASDHMSAAIERTVANLTNSGVVSAVGNRRAFRVGLEPLDSFRRYAAVYAREQAYCHFSPALIANLEKYWDAQNRRI